MATRPSPGREPGSTLVAEYVRMSTDKQDMSIANQQAAIGAYAAAHHMMVVRSYRDEGKSGLDISGRAALTHLINDVQDPGFPCQAILVLDISRWGRFQDVDESAFYEHLCRRRGVRVIYVAELFGDEQGPLGALLKGLKRSMAAEYSRELSAKVFAGQTRLVRAGCAMGGPAPFGYSRQLVTATGEPRAILKAGERKSIASDRVRLVPGPASEIQVVRRIFRQAGAGMRLKEIARRLNLTGSRTRRGTRWTNNRVRDILANECYLGTSIFGRDTNRAIRQPAGVAHDVIRVEHAFPALVSRAVFDKARIAQHRYSTRFTDEELLEAMRCLWKRKGRITSALLFADRDTPTPHVYVHRFGSLRAAYKQIGYVQDRDLSFGDVRDRMQGWLPSVMGHVTDMLVEGGSTVERDGRILIIDETWTALFQLMQASHCAGRIRWVVPRWHGTADLYVGIRMDLTGDYPIDYLVVPAIGQPTWPADIEPRPDASARFYLFTSLGLFRELGAVSRHP